MGPTGPRGGIDHNEGETRVTLWDKYLFHGKYHPHIRQFRLFEGDTTRHAGYGQSLRRRKLVEEVFGWLKTVGGGRKLRYIGRERNRAWLELTAAAYNLVCHPRLVQTGLDLVDFPTICWYETELPVSQCTPRAVLFVGREPARTWPLGSSRYEQAQVAKSDQLASGGPSLFATSGEMGGRPRGYRSRKG